MSEKEFSLEDSEELLRNLKSGAPSEFEQLRSALSLLAHVPEMSVAEVPPALPSGFEQPARVVPIKSSKSRNTIVTSLFVAGLFATGTLAAAAVTGIGPALLVNAGHSAANFVRNVVGGAGVNSAKPEERKNVALGAPNPAQNNAPALSLLGPAPAISPSTDGATNGATNGENDGNQNESERDSLILPSISSVLPPLSLPTISSSNSDDNETESPTPMPSQTSDGKKSEDSNKKQSQDENSQSSSEDQNQSESQSSALPTPNISILPTSEPTETPEAQASAEPSILPTVLPTDTPTETPEETESPN